MKWVRAFLLLLVTAAVFWILNNPHGIIPPMGKLFNPFAGFWQNSNKSDKIVEEIVLPELQDIVHVVWDVRRVPHIFAKNDHDLYFAQGYITAKDRLWQMEFQTHSVAGRLSEIVGKRALEYDRFQRRIGMVYAAENSVRALNENQESKAVITAYTSGVNAYIKSLSKKELPLEYKILDYFPETWTVIKSALLLKYMAWDLTGSSSDYIMTQTREALGDSVMEQLFPYYPPFMNPVVPTGVSWDFKSNMDQKQREEYINIHRVNTNSKESQYGKGSNNWAVSGNLTKSGYPILCNDPHLGLNLPSIWYEIQLISPDVNAYGVSLPGAPAVIIGFNSEIAWGLTNAGSDVLDWYKIKFKDSTRKEYFYDGEWHETKLRVEEIKVRGEKTVLDTVCYTRHGPVVYHEGEEPFYNNIPAGSAMRWAAHDPSNELQTFHMLNRAKSYEDYLEALRFYDCPGQNLVFADKSGDIAIWHNGKFPLRWKGQGRYLLDGSNLDDEWKDWVPREHNPHVKNPDRGFVSSANQIPADSDYPYYLGWDYVSFERGTRINELLSAMKDITPEDMIEMQSDVMNLRARMLFPRLLDILRAKSLTPEEKQSYEELKNWNCKNRAELIAPTIFEYFWQELCERIWNDDMNTDSGSLKRPNSEVTIDLILNQPECPYFDDKTTADKETLDDLAYQAFQSANKKLTEEFGSIGQAWVWGKTRGTDIRHVAQIPGLGRINLETNGNSYIINAISKYFGPSWRMVVTLGPEVRAWGICPGGQSGNPGSRFYDNAVDDWIKGKAYELLYLKSPDEENPDIAGKTKLRGVK